MIKKLKLKNFLKLLPARYKKYSDINICGVTSDSNKVGKGYIFFALKGNADDGHKYIREAVKRGAVFIICEKKEGISEFAVPFYTTGNAKKLYPLFCSLFFFHPSSNLRLVGVTGTNGKTTIAWLLRHILNGAGKKSGMISTIEYDDTMHISKALNTTPSSEVINSLLNNIVLNGADSCIMEVSSHAIKQGRISGLTFYARIFTNLSQEHLDYHKNMEEYFNVKKSFFSDADSFFIINADDKYGKKIIKEVKRKDKIYTYGRENSNFIYFDKLIYFGKRKEQSFLLFIDGRKFKIHTRLLGEYNVYNIMAAVSLSYIMGLNPSLIARKVSEFAGAKGRFEPVLPVVKGAPLTYVDYAHTPDAFENILKAINKFKKRDNIAVIFGCGGDRDKKKRPIMGGITAKYAGKIYVTNDNPRYEDENKIINDILKGVPANSYCKVIPDRSNAIAEAVRELDDNHILLILGKGHENYMEKLGRKYYFSDADVASKFIYEKGKGLL